MQEVPSHPRVTHAHTHTQLILTFIILDTLKSILFGQTSTNVSVWREQVERNTFLNKLYKKVKRHSCVIYMEFTISNNVKPYA